MAKAKKKEEEPKKRGRGRPKGCPPNKGSFKKGQSANPGGLPKADHTLRDVLRAKHAEIEKTLFEWLHNENLDFGDRLKVMDRILERAYGKVPTPVDTPVGGGAKSVTVVFGQDDEDA